MMKGVIPSKHFIGQESSTYETYEHEVFLTIFVEDFNGIFDSTNALTYTDEENHFDNL